MHPCIATYLDKWCCGNAVNTQFARVNFTVSVEISWKCCEIRENWVVSNHSNLRWQSDKLLLLIVKLFIPSFELEILQRREQTASWQVISRLRPRADHVTNCYEVEHQIPWRKRSVLTENSKFPSKLSSSCKWTMLRFLISGRCQQSPCKQLMLLRPIFKWK